MFSSSLLSMCLMISGLLTRGSFNQRKRNMSLSSVLFPTIRNAFSMSVVRVTEFQQKFVSISNMRGMKFSPTSKQSSRDHTALQFFADPTKTTRTTIKHFIAFSLRKTTITVMLWICCHVSRDEAVLCLVIV